MSEKYEAKTLLFRELGKITKPPFQRGFKWSLKKQRELIDTVKQGLPFGTFLVEQLNDGEDKYSILDGQQRYTTLLNFKKDRTPFITNTDIDINKLLEKLLKIGSLKKEISKCTEKISKINYKGIFREKKCNEKEVQRAIASKILQILDMEECSPNVLYELNDAIYDWITTVVLEDIDIDNIKIPVIILTDRIEDKADVFVKLNQGGIKLTKYELLAAKWNDEESKLCCDDQTILDEVVGRYTNVNSKEIEFDAYDEEDIRNTDNNHKNITVYEYLYALSKLIDKCICEVTNRKKTSDSDYGFIIVSEIFDILSSNMDGLDKVVAKFKDLNAMTSKILESTTEIFTRLREEFTANDNNVYLDHTENQIATFIVLYFKTRYAIENGKIVDKKSSDDKRNLKNLMENLPQHYIYENIADLWTGTGDKKLHDKTKNSTLKNSSYYNSVDKKMFIGQLSKWFSEKNGDDAKSIKPDTKMILAYILNKTCSKEISGKEYMNNCQWEHIGIKDKLIKEKATNGISSPANLTLIPKYDNMKKHKLTYYELVKEHKNETLFKFDKEELNKFLYPEHDDIKWVEGTKDITQKEFDDFMEKRTKFLIDLIEKYLFK